MAHGANHSGSVNQPCDISEGQLALQIIQFNKKNHTPQRSYTDSFLWDANWYQLDASQNNRNV